MKKVIGLLLFSVIICFIFSLGKESLVLDYTFMSNYDKLRWEQDSSVLVLSGNSDFPSKSLKFSKGKHTIIFKAKGTSANHAPPHFQIILGPFTLKDMQIKEGTNNYTINFELPNTIEAPLRFIFDNDYNDATGDRNIFLFFPLLMREY